MTRVLVTGGTGFVAGHVIDVLLKRGHSVVTTVRSEQKAQSIRNEFQSVGKEKLEFAIVPDIAAEDAFQGLGAFGLEAAIHIASPFHYNITDAKKDLIDPAVLGTTSVLDALHKTCPTVRRVALTSSFAAILDHKLSFTGAKKTYTEADWSPLTMEDAYSNPGLAYAASKAFAEKAAWDFIADKKPDFSLITICPPMVYGLVKDTTPARISEIAEGSLDYVIANAGLIALWSQWDAVDVLAKDPERLVKHLQDSFKVNVIGNFHLFNLFTPLVLRGQGKKVIAISSGMSDIDFIRQFDIEPAPAYAISKAGTSVLTAKFAARYAKEGVLFMSICPGSVDSGFEGELTEEQKQKVAKLGSKFVNYALHFMGPSTPVDSAKAVLKVVNEASLEKGSSGALVSKFGNKQWMAFFRFEIYCRVFPADNISSLETVSVNDEFSSLEQFDLFVSRLSPWEMEEIACVDLYVNLMIRDYINELESQFMSAADRYSTLTWHWLYDPESEVETETDNDRERRRKLDSLVELTALDSTSLSLFSKEGRYRSADNISYMASLGLDFIYDLCFPGERRFELIRSNCRYSREFLPDALRYSPTWPADHQYEEITSLENDSSRCNLGYLIFSRVEGDERVYKPITTTGGRYSCMRQFGYVFWDSERILSPEIYDKLEDATWMLWQDITFRFDPGAQKGAGESLEGVKIQQVHMEELETDFGYISRPRRANLK
ncbi:aldehyde reductase II [Fusarium phyllophilum]|uniref:Aldehyde reductase II n=1 Tax=Fusarium phyllophilum TaxID=47803 RepID=A0A8H5IDI2_9HYPO|nr:aldehyde reductase II [Fusarium phyllophilum]